MRKPNFFIAGASRSGTTSLWHYLREHPEIFAPEKKELRYFDKNEFYGNQKQYLESFSGASDEKYVLDASPPYFYDRVLHDLNGDYLFSNTSAAERIYQFNPEAKILITLRSPVDRAYSQYWKNRTRQELDDDKSFKEVIKLEANGVRNPEDGPTCWLFKNNYPIHLSNWLELFPEDQVKIIIFEEWVKEEEEILREICRFLDIDPDYDFGEVMEENWNSGTPYKSKLIKKLYRSNPILKYVYRNFIFGSEAESWIKKLTHRSSYPPMSDKTRELVYEQLEDEIDQTEEILERDLDVWKV